MGCLQGGLLFVAAAPLPIQALAVLALCSGGPTSTDPQAGHGMYLFLWLLYPLPVQAVAFLLARRSD
ncbi:MAG: hypothetical protein R3F61_07800 [Myxococcota bacterium]